MQIYVFNEHCKQAGQVVNDPENYLEPSDDEDAPGVISDDVRLYGIGTSKELISQALDSLKTRFDRRDGGAGDHYRWKCDRAVLSFLGGPEVIYDGALKAYIVDPSE